MLWKGGGGGNQRSPVVNNKHGTHAEVERGKGRSVPQAKRRSALISKCSRGLREECYFETEGLRSTTQPSKLTLRAGLQMLLHVGKRARLQNRGWGDRMTASTEQPFNVHKTVNQNNFTSLFPKVNKNEKVFHKELDGILISQFDWSSPVKIHLEAWKVYKMTLMHTLLLRTWETHLLITAGAQGEVFNDLKVGLDIQQVGFALAETQLQHELKKTFSQRYLMIYTLKTLFPVVWCWILTNRTLTRLRYNTEPLPLTLALSLSRSCTRSLAVSSSGATSVTNFTSSSTFP